MHNLYQDFLNGGPFFICQRHLLWKEVINGSKVFSAVNLNNLKIKNMEG